LANAWQRTYGLPVVMSNCSNNYGPYHFPEKLIPLIILNALHGEAVPVYGAGENLVAASYRVQVFSSTLFIAYRAERVCARRRLKGGLAVDCDEPGDIAVGVDAVRVGAGGGTRGEG
jgi:hypothetical protein